MKGWIAHLAALLVLASAAYGQVMTPPGSTTGQIPGTTTNDNACAGCIGEFQSVNTATSTVSLTTGTNANLATLALTAGDWDVNGTVGFNVSATAQQFYGALSTVSATLSNPNFSVYQGTGFGGSLFVLPSFRVSSATPVTVYAVGTCFFSSGSCTGGAQIYARRRR